MMIIPPVLQLVIVFMLELFCFTALVIMKGEVLINADEVQKQELVYLALRVHVYGSRFFVIFLGLWITALGVLIYRSGFAPRIIAILSVIGGVGFYKVLIEDRAGALCFFFQHQFFDGLQKRHVATNFYLHKNIGESSAHAEHAF